VAIPIWKMSRHSHVRDRDSHGGMSSSRSSRLMSYPFWRSNVQKACTTWSKLEIYWSSHMAVTAYLSFPSLVILICHPLFAYRQQVYKAGVSGCSLSYVRLIISHLTKPIPAPLPRNVTILTLFPFSQSKLFQEKPIVACLWSDV
jgi:hypothetical protein